ncbi:methyltransferase domain-containing protein (plasmid) [Bradyrhizobium sp. ISRA443]|uniref:class I SAM-dependent methyltransferase n=1 Tax=unclassified Bradyrhizobium TaxID=2631580 RepID=UPI0024791E49|nr:MULTISPECIES: methyltransferase domain-containing protein [unclassified Bradyrhizobium]WGS03117.1 methyltransferase domain-containing protein [Bradyrhizobium sp. ISRA436]WGS09850.1 methyltransferase domain-containing protein [Bradyrhizobium sp. ISRA437]WGS16735.1 methyltransferase domain-containing protein [Bradyrhizobium sp. ISRA443]
MNRRAVFVGLSILVLLYASPWPAHSQPGPKVGDPGPLPPSPPPQVGSTTQTVTINVPINSDVSLVHVGSNDSFAITAEGRQAATLLLNALEEPDEVKAHEDAVKASSIYDQIIPRENYGGEYSALQWFADYIAADPAKRPSFLRDPQVAFFFHVYGSDNFAVLKEYLFRKYRLREIGDEETKAGQDRKVWLEDTILFENPRRESWERSSELLKRLDVKPGEKIADVGSGPGYFSFRFAKLAGSAGRVYAIEMNADHLRYIEQAKKAMAVNNVFTVETDGKSVGLAGIQTKVDAIFLCSLYHNMYAMSTKPERDSFIASIKESLTDNGRLFLVDNGLVPPGVLPYHGPYVAKELIIGQMLNYGFELVKEDQYIPQRYLLVFKVKKAQVAQDPKNPGAESATPKPTEKISPPKKRKSAHARHHRT